MIEKFLRDLCGTLNWDYSELEEICPELIKEATEDTKSFIQEIIKMDRINVANHAKIERISDSHPGEIFDAEGNQLCISNKWAGEYIRLNKESIINSPEIEL
jgi:hypothetical protein